MFVWGIIGLGRIAQKFAFELNQTGIGTIGAAGSRSIEKAKDFVQEFGGLAYGSYDELIHEAQVDAIYVAVPHPMHYEITRKCLERGIPVLCEKPFTIHREQLRSLVDLARKNRTFLMEAMWSRFMPHILWIKNHLDNNMLGKCLHLKADFSFKGKERGGQGVKRLIENELGGGALLDIGVYPVFLSHLLLGVPSYIQAVASLVNDIDEQCHMIFKYDNGASAILNSSILWESEGRAEIYCEQGTIIIPRRWHENNEIHIHRPGQETEIKKWEYPSRGFVYEMQEVQNCLSTGQTESKLMSLDFSLAIMDTLDKVRSQIGLRYPADHS